MFGIPASKLLAAVDGTSMTYTNTEMVNREYIQDTLMQYINPIEDALSDLLPRGQTVKLKLDGLMRADTAARYAALATATWMTVNEKRALDNLPPLPGGDELAAPTPVQAPTEPQANTDTQGVPA
jgi:phage portal protein BeeE